MSWHSVPIVAGTVTVVIISSYFHLLSHTLILGASVQSAYFERRMKLHVGQMAAAATIATELQIASTRDHALALRYRESAILYAESAIEMYREAAMLEEKAQIDFAEATGFQVASREWAAKAAVEGEQAAQHAAVAIEEELEYDALVAAGVIESAMAVRDEEIALADVEAVAMCEWIPFLNIICDCLGGAAAIGFHVKAYLEASEAAADFTAAAALKIEEMIEITLAESLEVQSIKDATVAEEYGFWAKEKLEQAEVEQEAAILRKEEGDYEMVLSYEENAKAAAFEASAGQRSFLAGRSLAASVTYGVGGAIDAVIISMSSFCVLGVTAFKFIFFSVIPAVCVMSRGLIESTTRDKKEHEKFDIFYTIRFFLQNSLRLISFSLIHIWVFIGSSLLFYDKYANFVNMSIRGKGGLIFVFAIISTSIQCVILQIFNRISRATAPSTETTVIETLINRIGNRLNILSKMLWMFLKDFIFFFLVYVLEFLIVWLNLGRYIIGTELQLSYAWLPLAFLPILVILHKLCLEHTISASVNKDGNQDSEIEINRSLGLVEIDLNNERSTETNNNSCEYMQFNNTIPEDSGVAIHEKTRAIIAWLDDDYKFHRRISLLDAPAINVPKPDIDDTSSTLIFDRYTFVWNLRNLDLLFETLAASFMIALFLNSVPNFQLLSPVISYLVQKWIVKIGMLKIVCVIVIAAMIVPISCLLLMLHFWR